MTSKNTLQVQKMVLTAIFAALSIIVGFFEIPWPPMPFLKLDFSEVIVLTSLLVVGLPRTIIVIIIRSLIRELIVPKPFEPIPVIGELMAILGSIVIVVLYRLIFVKKEVKTEKASFLRIKKPEYSPIVVLKGSFVALGFAVFMTLLNFFITLPIFLSGLEHFNFISFINDPAMVSYTQGTVFGYSMFVISGFLPFNIVKGVITIIAFDVIKIWLSEMNLDEKSNNKILEKTKRTNS